jgi:hypothetical protein
MRHPALKLLLLAMVVASVASRGQAQDSALRTVSGSVVDKSETGIPAAVVYLENVRTLTVQSHITDGQGQYHFSGLDPNVDYEIHAEHDDLTSNNRTISSFDTRKAIVVNLKVDKEKKKSGK